MQVVIKKLDIVMEVKKNGIEFEVRKSDGTSQIGDVYLTSSGLIWCEGRTQRENGVKLSWEKFAQIMHSDDSVQKAVKAAKIQAKPL